MKSRDSAIALLLLLCIASTRVDAQTKTDEDTVRALPQAMCNAWAKHDGHEMALLMAEDVDFVTVATYQLNFGHAARASRHQDAHSCTRRRKVARPGDHGDRELRPSILSQAYWQSTMRHLQSVVRQSR